MTRRMLLSLAVLVPVALASGAALAQSAPGSATLRVESPLTVAPTAPKRLAASATPESAPSDRLALADAPTVIMVGGDPNRVYRVRVPNASATGPASGLRIISDNAGDVSESGVGRLDAEGRDRLEISGYNGLMTVVDGRPTIPLSIVYE
jgi:hypothetical protein